MSDHHPQPLVDAQRQRVDSDLPPIYRRQGVMDLATRTRMGALFLIPTWLILMQADGYLAAHRRFAILNAIGLAMITIGRALFQRRLAAGLELNFASTLNQYRALSLAQAVYWGVLCAIVFVARDSETLRWLMLVSTGVIAAVGSINVAIDTLLPKLYSAAYFGPVVFAAVLRRDPSQLAISLLGILLYVYCIGIARVVGQDYWARQRAQAQLEQRAHDLESISHTDALTQIPNRLYFQERLGLAWRDACRRHEPLSLAMVDLDHFKSINDKLGHPFGDRCLHDAAQALGQAIRRPGDMVARYGGEEFIVLMPNTDLAGARSVAQRMLEHIAGTEVRDTEHQVILSCSIGVASCMPSDTAESAWLVHEADKALYLAKQGGRARVVCHDEPPASQDTSSRLAVQ